MSLLDTTFRGRRRLFWGLALVAFLADQITKLWLWHHPDEGRLPVVVIPYVLRIISHAGNARGALGLGPSTPAFYVVASIVALGIVAFFFVSTPPDKTGVQAALGLVTGGALGNLVDRVARGSVRDFIDLHWGEALHWHTFNMADVAICMGVGLILWDTLFVRPPATGGPSGGDQPPGATG